ncbi:hypothetical protein LCGC14_2319490 [marine sediment metagenome]|uniref:Uncharacterized protein n=1 Tax=marine sediment metagenome TaxID=412755 RepID=A0A0F9CIB5_9ZZZZ
MIPNGTEIQYYTYGPRRERIGTVIRCEDTHNKNWYTVRENSKEGNGEESTIHVDKFLRILKPRGLFMKNLSPRQIKVIEDLVSKEITRMRDANQLEIHIKELQALYLQLVT